MSPKTLVVDALLALSVLVSLVSAVGLLAMRNAYQKLHYLGPPSTVCAALLAAALWLSSGAQAGIKGVFVVVILASAGAIVGHATARALWIREGRGWPPERDDAFVPPAPGERS